MTPRVDHHFAETVAGRKFLETLRQHHDEDDVNTKKQQKGIPNSSDNSKENLKDMRSKLEGLLVAYLTNLSPGGEQLSEELNGNSLKNIRKKRDDIDSNVTKNSVTSEYENKLNSNELDVDAVEIDKSDNVSDAPNKTSAIKFENKKRLQIGVRNITVVNSTELNSSENTNDTSAQNECNLRKQRITVLDRYDLNNSMQKETNSEHNIRLLLNYR